jgi:hypothetical protein
MRHRRGLVAFQPQQAVKRSAAVEACIRDLQRLHPQLTPERILEEMEREGFDPEEWLDPPIPLHPSRFQRSTPR